MSVRATRCVTPGARRRRPPPRADGQARRCGGSRSAPTLARLAWTYAALRRAITEQLPVAINDAITPTNAHASTTSNHGMRHVGTDRRVQIMQELGSVGSGKGKLICPLLLLIAADQKHRASWTCVGHEALRSGSAPSLRSIASVDPHAQSRISRHIGTGSNSSAGISWSPTRRSAAQPLAVWRRPHPHTLMTRSRSEAAWRRVVIIMK